MKKTIFFIAVALLCLFFKGYGQARDKSARAIKYAALGVGDRVPDLIFKNVVNYTGDSLQLSGFKRRAVLLDFWATYCGSCVSGLVHLKEVERKYGRYISIVIVDTDVRETRSVVEGFLKRQNEEGNKVGFPFVLDHQALPVLFPHKSIPHYVWIGADGRVKAITSSKDLTDGNLERLVSGYSLDLPVKEDQ